MAALIDYAGPATVTFNGRPALEIANIKVNRLSNAKAVKTLAKGLAGRSKGAPTVSISWDSAVPATGFELPINTLVFSQDIIEIGVVMAATEEVFDVWIDSDDTNSSVDAATMQAVSLTGRFITAHPA